MMETRAELPFIGDQVGLFRGATRPPEADLEFTSTGRVIGGKPFSRGALYLMLRNRTYRGEIVRKGQSHPGEHTPIIDQLRWDAVQAQLAGNSGGRNAGTGTRQPSLLVGMLFDAEGNRMTPSYAVKKGTRYRYYVSRSLITQDERESSTALRIPAGEIEHLVTSRACVESHSLAGCDLDGHDSVPF